MRRAFELAFSTAYVFSAGQPYVRIIDDVQFQRPVEIGHLLRLNAHIVATSNPTSEDDIDPMEEGPRMAVEVSTQPRLKALLWLKLFFVLVVVVVVVVVFIVSTHTHELSYPEYTSFMR